MMKRLCLLGSLYFAALILVACRNEGPKPTQVVVSPATTPPRETRQTSFDPPAEESLEPIGEDEQNGPTPIPSPEPQPNDGPVTLGASLEVPPPIRDRLQAITQQQPADFQWLEDEPELWISVGGDRPLANWVFAVAEPFYATQDDISLAELQVAWQEGALFATPQTAQLFRATWGEPQEQLSLVEVEELTASLWAALEAGQPRLALVPFEQLSPQLKVLRVDGLSPVDVDFKAADYALTLPIGMMGPSESQAKLLAVWPEEMTNRDDNQISHVAMTGPAGMRRAVADRMEKYGLQYPAEETGPILQAVDIAHMSNENAFAPNCPMPDPYDSANVCNRAEYIELMTWMGIDVNEMTGNHLNDWGSDSLLYTFDLYESASISTFGGGRDLAQAGQPLVLEDHGNQIAFIGCNPVGPPSAWATADRPGSLPCDDYAYLKEQISHLAAEGYLVIATVQYREDYRYLAAPDQRQIFQELARAGAAAVSGSHGHHPQGFAFDGEAFIHYGLGNLLADQMWSLATRQTFIDRYLIYQGRLLNVDLWTGMNEDYARIRQMTPAERLDLLEAVFEVSERPGRD